MMTHHWRVHLVVLAFYVLIALVITFPLALNFMTQFAGQPHSDAYEMAHHIWWFKHALQTGQPLFYQTMLGYPDGIEGISLWAHPLQFFPAWLFVLMMPLPAAYNLMALLWLVLNGWTAYCLALHLTGRRAPALLGGLVFMAAPTMQGHLGAGHVGLLMQWTFVLYVVALFKLRAEDGAHWTLLTALLFVLSAWGHTIQIIAATLPITALFALMLVWQRAWRALARVIAAVALGGAALALFLLPVAQATFGTAAYVDEDGAARYSADLLAIVTPSFYHPFYGKLDYPQRVLGVNLDEGALYIGIVPLILAVIAIVRQRAARFWLALALVAWVCALGPLLKVFGMPLAVEIGDTHASFITLPWAWLASLPGFSLVRPGRFSFVLALAVAMLAAYGAAWVEENQSPPPKSRSRRQRHLRPFSLGAKGRAIRAAQSLIMSFALLVILFDYQTFFPLPTADAHIPDAIYALAARDDVRAVLDLPWANPLAAKDALYLQTAHHKALVAGQVTRVTPVNPAKLTILQNSLEPELLRAAGADIVIVHRQYDEMGIEAETRGELGEPVYEDERIAIFETPITDAVPHFMSEMLDSHIVDDDGDSHFFAPEDGWTTLSARLSAHSGRQVLLRLDGQVVQRWALDGAVDLNAPLPLTAGYHTATLLVEPFCPNAPTSALRCIVLRVDDLRRSDFVPGDVNSSIQFDRGVTLQAVRVPSDARAGETLPVWLAWRFVQPRTENEIRFVHVVDTDGAMIAQADETTGVRVSGDGLVEAVNLDLPDDLPAGEYRVFVGWYTYPDIRRFAVLSDVPGAGDGWAQIGTFTISSQALDI